MLIFLAYLCPIFPFAGGLEMFLQFTIPCKFIKLQSYYEKLSSWDQNKSLFIAVVLKVLSPTSGTAVFQSLVEMQILSPPETNSTRNSGDGAQQSVL